jgi:phosphoribosylformimino-5-aminoimidazole carboxamide ribotide isomerase
LILYPAIDIRGGKAVRLVQGDYDRETVYDADPLDAAKRWVSEGAQFLHVVDLDGAREGRPVNLEHVRRIAAEAGVPIQCGGGLRDEQAVAAALEAGAERAVVGTVALRDPDLVGRLVDEHGDRIVVGVDTRRGRVAVAGWLEETEADPADLITAMAARGVSRFIYTPVEADGLLEGPATGDLPRIAAAAPNADLIYSGGIGSLDHLRALAALAIPNLTGVIVGRALYDRRFGVSDASKVLPEEA